MGAVNGTPVIGFLSQRAPVDEDSWMSDEEIKSAVLEIRGDVKAMMAERAGDVKEVESLYRQVVALENRVWFLVAGTAAAFGAAILGLIL